MTRYEFGDVILVPFPFTDQTKSKKRPAVVISSESYNVSRPDIVLLALSSNLTEPSVELNDWAQAGLPKATAFKPIVSTLESNLIIKPLGKLSAEDTASLRSLLKMIFG